MLRYLESECPEKNEAFALKSELAKLRSELAELRESQRAKTDEKLKVTGKIEKTREVELCTNKRRMDGFIDRCLGEWVNACVD